MIVAGTPSQIAWGDGNWVFLDMGFSRHARSCGILVGNGNPTSEQFGAARREMVSLAKATHSPLNLVIEAPLSVCFSAAGNPKGRSIEKEGSKTRYWYNGLGCTVMVAAMYLIRDTRMAHLAFPVRLFEGFVSYKDRTIPSDHKRDVLLLREIVREPAKFSNAIFSSEKLKQKSTDELFSAFCVAGLDCGVPAVIKHQVSYKLGETEADMARTRHVSTTTPGHVNPQQQRVIRRVGPSNSFPGQYVYELECQRDRRGGGICGHRYGANGCDIDGAGGGNGRQCPLCQGGTPGEPI
jgi:hypothetical protein